MTNDERHETRKHKKTRNVMLYIACTFVFLYTITDIVLGYVGAAYGYSIQLDSTLTDRVFDYAIWLCGGTAAITVAKTIKGSTNSDETEPIDIPTRDDSDCRGE